MLKLTHKAAFKFLCSFLVLTHLFCFYIRDAAYAKSAPASTASSSKTSASSSATSSSSSSASSSSSSSSSASAAKPKTGKAALHNAAAPGAALSPAQLTGVAGFNLSALKSFQSDPFTGRATFSVPVAVPAGRKGIQPNLALTYGSGSGNGPLGLGWSMELGAIERSTKRGVPKYDSTDTFVFNSAGSSQELVRIAYNSEYAANEYRAKIEGAFMRLLYNGRYWLAQDKNGVNYLLGQTPEARIEDGNRVFKWCLDRVEDLHGNGLNISYTKEQNLLYPREITYLEAAQGGQPLAKVEFIYESRPDRMVNFRSGFKVVSDKRLQDIRVSFNNQLLRRYRLTYTLSEAEQSILSSVTQYGADDTSSLPALSFTYEQQDAGWETTSQQLPDADRNFDWKTTILDVNNDGLPDILTNDGHNVYLGTKEGSWQETSSWKLPDGITPGVSTRFADFNADGWVDVIQHVHGESGGDYSPRIYLNNKGNGWIYSEEWSRKFPSEAYFWYDAGGRPADSHSTGGVLVDVNADGFIDYLQAKHDGRHVFLGTDSGWEPNTSFTTPDGTSFYDGSTQIADVNSDGLPDLVVASGGSRKVFLNTGRGWQEDAQARPPSDSEINFSDNSTQLADVNSDGLTDLVVAKGSCKKTFINKQNHSRQWEEDSRFRLPQEADFTNQQARLADAQGRALPDLLLKGPVNRLLRHRYTRPSAYLTKIDNGLGGEISVSYKPSTQFDNTTAEGICGLPFPLYVVDSVTIHDTVSPVDNGNPASPDVVTRYEYAKGLFDFTEREFRGFGIVKAFDSDGNYSESHFLQSAIYKGKLAFQQTRDAQGNLFSRAENTWRHTQPHNGVYYVFLEQSDSFSFDGISSDGGNYRHTRSNFEYDNYGNPLKVIFSCNSQEKPQELQVEKIQVNEYAYNTSRWIMQAQTYASLRNRDNQIITEKWLFYDNNVGAQRNAPPTRCLLTQERTQLINPITRAKTFLNLIYNYDGFGNLTSSTDLLGRTTRTEYDQLTAAFPIKITNSLNQCVETVYYGINESNGPNGNNGQNGQNEIIGFGLPGQVKYTQDLNAERTYQIYDCFGRLTKSIGPYDREDAPAVIYEYNLTQRPLMAIQRQKIDYSDNPQYLTSYTFYDGLGRVIISKTPAQDEPGSGRKRQIVSGIVKYDNKGRVIEKYLPYFTDESADYTGANFDTYHTKFTYDALGRLIKTTNADDSYSYATYSTWSVTSFDENSHYKTNYFDALGRIIKVEEHNSNETYTTRYQYDALGNLTQVTDNQGNVTRIYYDNLGRKLKMDDPDMGIWSYEYDAVGNLIRQTDAKGQALVFAYDSLNRLFSKGTEKRKAMQMMMKDPEVENLVTYIYDDSQKPNAQGRLSKVIDLSGSTEFFYDKIGREIKSIKTVNGSGRYTVERSYDALGRLVNLTYPDSSAVTYSYNPQGVESVEEAAKEGTATIPQVPVPDAYVRFIEYTPTNQIKRIQYGNGTETNYDYDPKTLRLKDLVTDSPAGSIQALSYTFDNVGNVTNINDRVNTATQTFGYDHLNRLTSANGSYGNFSYNYDSIGNMIYKEGVRMDYGLQQTRVAGGMRLPHAVTSYGDINLSYDANGNLISKEGFAPQVTGTATEGAGTIPETQAPVPDASTKLLLDAENSATVSGFADRSSNNRQITPQQVRLDSRQSKSGLRSFSFNGTNSYLSIPDSEDWNFGQEDFTIDFWVRWSKAPLWNFFISHSNDLGPDQGWQTSWYQDRLKFWFKATTGDAHEYGFPFSPLKDTWYHLAYVRKGNQLSCFVNGSQAGSSYDLTGITIKDSTAGLTIGASRNIAGNYVGYFPGWLDNLRITKGLARWSENFVPEEATSSSPTRAELSRQLNAIPKASYTYDCENRLTKALDGDRITSFAYDGDGGRVSKVTRHKSQDTSKTTYIGSLFEKQRIADSVERIVKHIFAGSQRVCSVEQIQEAVAPKLTSPTAARLAPANQRAVIAVTPQLPQQTAMAAASSSGLTRQETRKAPALRVSYYHPDHLGSSNVITDGAGRQVACYEYTPYGSFARGSTGTTDLTELTSPTSLKHFFTGKELDSTGLYYYGARYYDPQLGRFTQPDTIVQAPYDPQSLNRYSYCRNNPLNYVDPTGHSWWKKFWGSIVGAVVGAVVGIFTANPALGFMTYSAISSGINSAQYGGNFGQGFGIGLGIGVVSWGIGAGVGGIFGEFWGTLAGGAGGGAFGAGITGGDPGRSALAGLAGSFLGYGGPLGALIGGGVSSEIMGGDFGTGVAGAALYLGATWVGKRLPLAANKLAQGLRDLHRTDFAKTDRGREVTSRLDKFQWRGQIKTNDSKLGAGTLGQFDDVSSKTRVSLRISPQVTQEELPGVLAHEGTHSLYKWHAPNSFQQERECYNNGYAVDQQRGLNPSYPSDDWIRSSYGFGYGE